MYLQGVADDPLPHFPWLIEVETTQGITHFDVFDAITRTFLEHVTEEKYNSWTTHRKTGSARADHQRARTPRVDPDEVPDGYLHPSTHGGKGDIPWSGVGLDDG